MTEFCAALSEILNEKGLNLTRYSRLLGANSGLVFQIFQGQKPVPLDRLDKWLDVLELPEDQRRALEIKAIEQYAPTYVKKLLYENNVRVTKWMENVVESARKKGFKLDAPAAFSGTALADSRQKPVRRKPST